METIKKLTIHFSGIPLSEAIEQIEAVSNYTFFYDVNQTDLNQPVSLRVNEQDIEVAIAEMLKPTDLTFRIVTRQIVLQPKQSTTSQTGRRVRGTVTDDLGDPLAGVNIVIKGTTIGMVTDMDGNYELSHVPAHAILQFSFIGMETREETVGNKTVINITLSENAIALSEFVAIGYGTTRKKDLTGTVASVKAENMNVESTTNVLRAMQGKMAGVDIVSYGGEPGSDISVMIRGVGTFNNNAPLYIVDGMYIDNISFLNPNDIEFIDVLKDASSAAIYGSRAANGVIIVTTKSGGNTSGTPTIHMSTNIGFQHATKRIDVLNAADWIRISTASREAVELEPLDMAVNPHADTDWQDLIMRTGLMQNYNLSAQSGASNFKYYIAGGYTNQEGIIRNSGYERLNLQVKTEFKKGIFTVGENILVSYDHNIPMPTGTSRVGGIMSAMLLSIPTYTVYDDTKEGGFNGPWGDVITLLNPVAAADMGKRRKENYKTYINTYAEVELPFDLKYKLNVNTDLLGSYRLAYETIYNTGLNQNNRNKLSEERGQKKNMLIENLLTFDRQLGDHKVTALTGYTYQQNKYRLLTGSGAYMPDKIMVLDAATESQSGSRETVATLTSVLGRVFYSYKNKYLVNVTLRRDGSSKFMKDYCYGNFPSFSLGWNIAEETFMEKFDFLDMLKLRGSYGVLGNQEIDNYLYSSDVTSNINYLIDGNMMWNGSFPKVFASPTIKWENTEMTNIGLDVVLLNSKLKFTAEYYIKNTTDILLNVPNPSSTGADNDPLVNAGHIRNKGFEFLIGWDKIVSKDLSYSLSLVGSTVKNEVIRMGTGDQVIWSGRPNQSGANTTKSLQGYPIGGFWLIPTDGLFQSEEEVEAHSKDGNLIQPNAKPGDIRFVDTNGNGLINDDDRVYQGSPFPDLILGVNAYVKWRDFDLSLNLQASFEAKIYNSMRSDLEDVSKGQNYSAKALNYWSQENSGSNFPRVVWGDPNQNARTDSDRFLENGDYLRISNVQLGYNIPRRIVPFLEAARVYLNIDNLHTFTGYSGYTPDVNRDDILSRGVDYYSYPLPRTFVLGLNVSF
ncbi:MAG: TonB-dependent receptor [Tannerellaceae bacterium]|nr:TonB-dependent receptor [Tannerellaceae bacterium]